MVWMAGAIDVAGNLEERHWAGFPKMTKAMFDKWGCKTVGEPAPCQDPDSEYGRGFPEWNVWGDVPAVDYIFRTTDFPIYLAPLDLADQLPEAHKLEFLDVVGEEALCYEVSRRLHRTRLAPHARRAYVWPPETF